MTDVPPRDPGTWPTPEQFVAEWNQLTPAEQHARATQILDCMQTADRCHTQQHDARLGVDSPVANTTPIRIACPDCSQPVQVPVLLKQDGAGAVRLALPEDEFSEAFAAHAMAEPERHPTLVTQDETEQTGGVLPQGTVRVIGDDQVAAAHGTCHVPGMGYV